MTLGSSSIISLTLVNHLCITGSCCSMSGSTMVSADSQMGSDEPKSRSWPCSKAHAKGSMFKGTGSHRE